MKKYEEKLKDLEEYNINLENKLKFFIQNKSQKNDELTLEDEIFINKHQHKIENIKKELNHLYEEKNFLEREIHELKCILKNLKENKETKKKCCFM